MPNLEISREQRVLRVTLNRPEKRNALTSDMCRDIADTVEGASMTLVGAIIIDAKGDVFCAGMDLDSANAEQTGIHQRLFTLGVRAEKPHRVRRARPGARGRRRLICNTHVAVAAHGSSFGLTEIRIGMGRLSSIDWLRSRSVSAAR